MNEGWTDRRCWGCGGHGLVSEYTLGGTDFLGAMDCRTCKGTGTVSVHNASGMMAAYPGGPARGCLTKEEHITLFGEVDEVVAQEGLDDD